MSRLRLKCNALTRTRPIMTKHEVWQQFASEIETLRKAVEKQESKVPSDEHPDYSEVNFYLQQALDELNRVHGIKPKRTKKN